MSLQFVLGQNLIGPKGSDGSTIIGVRGPPDGAVGKPGDYAYDVTNVVFYGPKTSSTAWPTGIALKGPKGDSTPQTLPQDFVANSFVVTPQSGDSQTVQYALTNANGTQLFLVDAQGNISTQGTLSVTGAASVGALSAPSLAVANNASVGGTLSVSGQSTLAAVKSASSQVTGNETVGGTLSVSGATTVGSLTTNGYTNLGDEVISGKLTVQGATTLASVSSASEAISGNAQVGGTLTVSGASTLAKATVAQLVDNGDASIAGNLTVSGTTTLGTTSTGALTATSLTSTGPTQSTGHIVTSNGTAQAPAFSFLSQPDTGLYLAAASATAAVLALAVNGTNAFNLSKTGLSLPGTLTVAGAITAQTSLTVGTTASITGAITGASTLSIQGAITGASTLAIQGAITGATTLGITGAATVKTLAVTQSSGTDSSGNVVSAVLFPGAFGGTSSYPPSGISSDGVGNLIFSYQGRSVIAFANPGYNSQAGTTPATAFGINFTAGAYTFGAGGATALLVGGNGSTTIGGGLSGNNFPCIITQQSGTILSLRQGTTVVGTFDTVGNATLANVVTAAGFTLSASGSKITFGDGTTQTTAYTATLANNQAKWIATSQGTTALPAFTYSANTDTGMYLKGSGTSGAVLAMSVNATDALTLQSSGIGVPGTLVVSGATTAAAITSSGTVKGTALTITQSGGALTFGDGTTQTTAAGAASAGTAATFTATGNGTAAAPAYTFTNSTNTGWYYTTTPSLNATVGGTATVTINKSAVTMTGSATVTSTLTVSGLASLGGGASVTGPITTTTNIQTAAGTATAPAFYYTGNTNTGISFEPATGTSSRVYLNANGTQVAAFAPTGLSVTGTLAVSGTQTFTGATTHSGAVSCASTLSVTGTQTFTGATSHAATVTSTTAAGTPSFVSSQGFVTSAYGGGYACSATAAPTTPQGLYTTVTFPDGTSPQVVGRSYINERGTGSVVGFHFYLQNSLTTSCQVRMNVNGTNTPYVTIASGSTTASVAYTKGQYPLPNNGYCYMQVMFGAASTGSIPQLQGSFTLELPA